MNGIGVLVLGVTISASTPPVAGSVPPVAVERAPLHSLIRTTRPPKGLLARALRVARTLFVGAWASALDLAVVSVCIRVFQLDSTVARLLGLVLSGVLLFFGNRSFAFRAQAGSISRQARLFVVSELAGLCLNLGVFRVLVDRAAFIPPEASSQIANFLVFITFLYPLRAFVVFRVPPPGS